MIQVIVPGFKVFPFSMRESWRTCLEENRIPHDWIVHKVDKVCETAKKIKKNSIILLLNDHHLHDLICHLNDSKSFGKNRDENLWMALATEKVVKSSFPDSEKKTQAAVNHIILLEDFFIVNKICSLLPIILLRHNIPKSTACIAGL